MTIPARALVGGAALLTFVGGSLHPDSSDTIPLQERMAQMTADTALWVFGHGLMTLGAASLVVGLLIVRRADRWPVPGPLLSFAIVAATCNTAELVLHTIAAVDHESLAAGQWPLLTVAHLGASLVTYPMFGAAIALLAWRLLPAWPPAAQAIGVLGVAAGLANAVSTPLAIVVDLRGAAVLFPLAAIGTAVWLATAALVSPQPVAARWAQEA